MLGKVLSPRTDRSIGKALRLPCALLLFATGALYAANVPVTSASAASPAALPAAIYSPASPAAPAPSVAPAVAAASRETTAMAVPAVFSRAQGLSPKVLAKALDAVSAARARGISAKSDRLTIIDYSLPSTQPRLWVLDLGKGKVLFHELVAHGAGSGDKYATRFSNVNDSRATSLGLFLTADTYEGGNGYSLKLKGLDTGINDMAEARHIVMHGAWYVSEDHARQFGMIGRSWGCPALPQADAPAVIDAIKGGSFVYSYAGSAPSAPTVMRASLSSSSHLAKRGRTARAVARSSRSSRSVAAAPVSRTR
ncbi:MAG: murein L,D-transpeptidase catalytic domain family protein [Thermoanaerobaculia bacterium]